MKNTKLILVVVISIILFFIFSAFEFEPLNQVTSKYIQSAIFSLTFLIVTIKPKLRIKIFYLTFLLFFLMVGFYLFQRLALANSLASVGIGIFFITSLSYLPELIKKGYIEKL